MLFILKKTLLLSVLILFFNACADKTNGRYHTKYSYHPYYSLYAKQMSKEAPKKKVKSLKKKIQNTKLSLNKNERYPNYSSIK
jgi:hypothetical protein